MNVAVVGGGVFGSLAALKLAAAGNTVTLFERQPDLLRGASLNANRLHLGFHYPRDDETARQCMRGYVAFKAEFGEAILNGVQNAYFVASKGSLTSPRDYLSFCDRLQLPYQAIDPIEFRPVIQNVDLGIITEEVIFDVAILRQLVSRRLRDQNVTTVCGHEVTDISSNGGVFAISASGQGRSHFDAVVNCSYADINRLTAQLGHAIEAHQHEYAAVPIIELDLPHSASITVLDGPFMSLLPYGSNREHLLYHVGHSVIARSDAELLDLTWLAPETSPFAAIDKELWYANHLESCCEFLPWLRGARLKGIAQGPRMVLAKREDTDARPSVVTSHEPGYLTVLAGKIDHCMWVADEVVRQLG